MAKNDMHVVVYKILSYLYECMKQGKEPSGGKFSAEALGINQPYWTAIMVELIERGLVKGFLVSRADDCTSIAPATPAVTMSGVEFLMENSMMKKAMAFVRDIKDFVPLP